MMLALVLRHDIRLQYRYGIYAAYTAVIALYAGVLVASAGAVPDWAVGLLIWSDPAALGFFFVGGLMLLEKGEGVRNALAISPLSARTYLFSKVLTLTAVSLIATALLSLAKGGPVIWWLMLASVALCSAFYLAVGVGFALRVRTINGYLLGSGALLTPVLGPALAAFVDPMPTWWSLYPPLTHLRLILVASGAVSQSSFEIGAMLLIAGAASVAAFLTAERLLRSELGAK